MLAEKLKTTKFSILTDESTDISATKTSCLLVRYYDAEEGKIVSKLWDLIQVLEPGKVTTATADHLYNNIVTSFEERVIPMKNVVGFGSDGCSVMMGVNNSVASRLKRDFPNITIMKCICHSLHTCASESCAELPRTCEDLARNVHNFFGCSSKRQCEYVEFQRFADVDVHKLLHPSQTRWLSLSSVVERILEQWPALLLYFNDQWLALKLKAAQSIHEALNDPSIKLFFLFLQWVLPKFTQAYSYFQSAKVMITDLHEAMVDLYKTLLFSFMKRNYVNSRSLSDVNPEDNAHYLPIAEMYLGAQVLQQEQSAQIQDGSDLLVYFREKCQLFLICVCREIRKRYDFSNSFFENLKILKPKVALSEIEREKTPSLIPLLLMLPRVCDPELYQAVDDEWRRLGYYPLDDEMKDMDTDAFWAKLLSLKNDGDVYLFKNVAQCALNILSLPHSNADSERVFSQVNLTKTKLRNRLIVPTIRGTLLTTQHVAAKGGCVAFTPSREMLSRMTKDSLYEKPKKIGSKTNDDEEEDANGAIFDDD